MSTDAIRSQLSDLVEDTNDVGNYEKAVAALKAKRSTYVPYRGSGGSVAQAGGQITGLQEQLHRIENQSNILQETEITIEKLRQEEETVKIRQAQLSKTPYMLIIGDKEMEENAVAVRSWKNGDLGSVNVDKFISDLVLEIAEKRR